MPDPDKVLYSLIVMWTISHLDPSAFAQQSQVPREELEQHIEGIIAEGSPSLGAAKLYEQAKDNAGNKMILNGIKAIASAGVRNP